MPLDTLARQPPGEKLMKHFSKINPTFFTKIILDANPSQISAIQEIYKRYFGFPFLIFNFQTSDAHSWATRNGENDNHCESCELLLHGVKRKRDSNLSDGIQQCTLIYKYPYHFQVKN